jgi:hypothetical protein
LKDSIFKITDAIKIDYLNLVILQMSNTETQYKLNSLDQCVQTIGKWFYKIGGLIGKVFIVIGGIVMIVGFPLFLLVVLE